MYLFPSRHMGGPADPLHFTPLREAWPPPTSPRFAKTQAPGEIPVHQCARSRQRRRLGKNDYVYGVTAYKPPAGADKIMRLHACTDRFERMKHRIGIIQKRLSLDESAALEHHREELDITRFGKPEDIGALAAFIVSPKGRWLHGSSIDIDGGQICPLRMSIYD